MNILQNISTAITKDPEASVAINFEKRKVRRPPSQPTPPAKQKIVGRIWA